MITFKSVASGLRLLAINTTLMSSALAGGDSSDGHTHGTAAPTVPVPINTAAPRVTSQTDQFELVGVLEGTVLTMYLDKFGTNAPVSKAQIEVASGSWKASATEIAPAIYTVAADALAQTGRHPLTLTVLAGDESDLMDATLEVGVTVPLATTAQSTRYTGKWTIWSGATALLLAALGLFAVRRRKQHRKQSPH